MDTKLSRNGYIIKKKDFNAAKKIIHIRLYLEDVTSQDVK